MAVVAGALRMSAFVVFLVCQGVVAAGPDAGPAAAPLVSGVEQDELTQPQPAPASPTPPAGGGAPAPAPKAPPPAQTGIPFLDNLLKDLPQEVPAEEATPVFPPLKPGQPRPVVQFDFEYANALNAHFSNKALRAMVRSQLGQPLQEALLNEDAQEIAANHRIRGYLGTRVGWTVDPQDNGDVVLFVIRPGPRAKLTRLEVHGNVHVPDEVLLEGMKHSTAGLMVRAIGFNPLNMLQKDSSGYYNPIYIDEDIEQLVRNYRRQGFFKARVNGVRANSVRNDKPLFRFNLLGESSAQEVWLSFEVDEGPLYRVGTLELDGDLPLSQRATRALMAVRSGSPARLADVEAGEERVLDVWRNRGHHSAHVVQKETVDHAHHLVDVSVTFVRGPVAHIGKVTIKHQNAFAILLAPNTRDHVVTRDLAFSSGSTYSKDALVLSEERLRYSGLFQKVTITPVASPEDPAVVDVEVEVVEQPLPLFNLAPAWVPGEGLVGFLLVGSRNILGFGWRANFQGLLSPRRFTMRLDAEEPRVLNSRFSLGFNVHRDRWLYPEFALVRTGGAMVLGYPLLERLFFSFSGNAELVDLDPAVSGRVEALANLNRFPVNKRRNTVRFDMVYDQRDNVLFPTKGFLLAAGAEYGGPLLLGEINFLSVSGNARVYIPLFSSGFIIKNNLSVGMVVNPHGGGVPVTERYYEGGPFQSVRGYGFQSITPSVTVGNPADPTGAAVGLRIGGTSRLVNNLELEMPALNLTPDIPLKAYLFLDAGNTWSEAEHPFFFPNTVEANRDGVWLPAGLFWGTGVGAMLVTPLFPMRVEMGIPLPITRRSMDNPFPPPFVSVGSSF